MHDKRIVITGIGIVSPIGIGKEAYGKALLEGKSGIKPITLFDTSEFNVEVGGEISEFDAKEILGKKGLVDFDRSTTLLLSAAKFAIEDSKLDINDQNTHEIGVSVGTTFGSLSSITEFDKISITEGPRFVNASRFPNTVINSPSSRLAIRHSIKGLNSTISTGFCSALDAIDYGINAIHTQRAMKIVAGSVEEMCVQTFLGFYNLDYLAGIKGGPVLSCPFDKRRNGIVFAEGSACFILEELDSALNRSAKIYAEILSTASVFQPYRLHKHQPQGKGMMEAMKCALDKASLQPEQIDCLYANANSTNSDSIETKAIKNVFGEHSSRLQVPAIKSMMGESYSASGGMALAAALGSLEKDFIPPTINYLERDPRCDLDYVLTKARKQNVNKVMINSFDPNGESTVLILGKHQ